MSDGILPAYDVVVVGTGIAGLFTALEIDENKQILVVTKDIMSNSNTNLAQGGIAVTFEESEIESHLIDTLKAGEYYNNEAALRLMIEEGGQYINTLIKWGVNFDTDEDGHLLLTKEGGHSLRRIIHYKDTTGQEIVKGLMNEVSLRSNIKVLEKAFIQDILVENEEVVGLKLIRNETEVVLYASHVVIATGGIGELYANTTNATIATGDGIAMAYLAGAVIKDMEFVQFHPTALNVTGHSHFLISEAVRGEGGILRNEKGQAFMANYHPMKDLAPRSIVSKAIFEEIRKQENDKIYLDVTHLGDDYIMSRFPNIYNECLKRGINILDTYIPITPVQHYIMGGIQTDVNGKTNIQGLYACGEVACTGVHGANRMASNSLLEGAVFAGRVANTINQTPIKNHYKEELLVNSMMIKTNKTPIRALKKELQNIMSQYVFIFRTEGNLRKAQAAVQSLSERALDYLNGQEGYELRNMIVVAQLIIEAAIKRKTSLGSHIIEGGL